MPDSKLFLSESAPVSRKFTVTAITVFGWTLDCIMVSSSGCLTLVGHKSIHPDEPLGLFDEYRYLNWRDADFMSPFPVCSDGLNLLMVPLASSRSDVSIVLLSSPDCIV